MKILNKILGGAIAMLVGIMVLACCWQVISRFILNDPSKYTEEFLRYALIWLTMLGAPYAYGQDKHLSINVLTNRFQVKNQKINKVFVELIVLALSIAVFIVGGIMVTLNSMGQISAAMRLPMEMYYIGLPISGGLMVVYCVERLICRIKEIKEEA